MNGVALYTLKIFFNWGEKFISHKTHHFNHFKAYSTVVSRRFTVLCSYHYYLTLEYFCQIISLNPISNTMKQVFLFALYQWGSESQRPEVTRVTKVWGGRAGFAHQSASLQNSAEPDHLGLLTGRFLLGIWRHLRATKHCDLLLVRNPEQLDGGGTVCGIELKNLSGKSETGFMRLQSLT